MIGGAFLGGGVELVPAGQCKIELQIMTEDRQNLTGTFTLTDGTHTYSVTAGADGRASVNVASGGTYTVTISNTGYDNISAQTVVSASATVKYVRFELPTANVKIGGAQTITGTKTFTNPIYSNQSGNAQIMIFKSLTSGTHYNDINYRTSDDASRAFIRHSIDTSTNANSVQISLRNTSGGRIGDVLGIFHNDNGLYCICPKRAYSSSNTTDIVNIASLQESTDVVHTTGNETIAGTKTFNTNIVVLSTTNAGIPIIIRNNNAPNTIPSTDTSVGLYCRPNSGSNNLGIIAHKVFATSGDGAILISAKNYKNTNATTMQINAPADGSAGYVTAPSRAYSSSNTTDIVTIGMLSGQIATSFGETPSDEKMASEKLVKNSLDGKQATLISGTNIKTINGTSVLGAGDISIPSMVTTFASTDVTTVRHSCMTGNVVPYSEFGVDSSNYHNFDYQLTITDSSTSCQQVITLSPVGNATIATGFITDPSATTTPNIVRIKSVFGSEGVTFWTYIAQISSSGNTDWHETTTRWFITKIVRVG